METKLSDAQVALREMIAKLEAVVPTMTMNTPVILHAITPHMQVLETSFGREVGDPVVRKLQRCLICRFSYGLQAFTPCTIGQW